MPIRQVYTDFADLVNGLRVENFQKRYVRDFGKAYIDAVGRQWRNAENLKNEGIRTYQRKAESMKLAEEQKQLDDIDQSYYVTVSYLLTLCEHASDIFAVAKANEKRQILSLILSNFEFDGKSVHYTIKES